MTEGDRTLEMMPWYVTGKLSPADAAAVARHLQACESCRHELAEVVWVKNTVGAEVRSLPDVRLRVWKRVLARVGWRDIARVDVGSMLVGFRLGVNARQPGSPVRASLRVMGRNVRIVGKDRRDECSTPGPNG